MGAAGVSSYAGERQPMVARAMALACAVVLLALALPASAGVASADAEGPTTTHALVGPEGDSGWYRGPVTVALTCTGGGSDCERTTFRVNGGAWQTYSSPFTVSSQGSTTIDYGSSDVAGNVEAVNSALVRIDSTAPSGSSSASGTSGDNGWYRSPVEITLSASDAHSGIARRHYRINGGSWQSYTSAFTISTQGRSTVEFRAVDVAGNASTVGSRTIRIDETAPTSTYTLSGTSGINGWYRSPVEVTVSASDAHSGIAGTRHRVNGGTWQTYSSPFTVSSQGSTTIDYGSSDLAGNVEAVNSALVRIDSTAPSVSSSASGTSGDNGWYRSPVEITLFASDAHSGIALREYRIDGGSWQSYTSAFTISTQGQSTVELRAVDVAGNASTVDSRTIRIDLIPPTVELSGSASRRVVYGQYPAGSAVPLEVEAADVVSGVLEVEFFVDGTRVALARETSTGVWAGTWATSGWRPGEYTLTALARDASGWTTSEHVRIVLTARRT